MSNVETTMDKTLAISLEKLKKLRDGDSEELPNMEKYVKDKISALLDAEAPIREVFIKSLRATEAYMARIAPHVNRNLVDSVELSGSVVEGATTARIFQVDKDLEIEVDTMCNYFTIPQKDRDLLKAVKNKPGFVRLPLCLLPACRKDWYIHSAKMFLGHHKNEQYSLEQMRQYISPLVIRDTAKYVADRLPLRDMYNYVRDLCGVDSGDPRWYSSLTETTVAEEWEWRSQGDAARGLMPLHALVGSFDNVPAVHLSFWPRQASGWNIRCRVWPPHDTIQSIVDKGCQVVPRTSPGGDVHSEWRLSFSRPEAALANLRSREQHETYYFFKMFFYRYLKCVKSTETEGKTLYSYIIKTIMLWACEELVPQDPIWASLENSVQMLLFKLLRSLVSGFLSHYFIQEINLLEKVGQDVRKRCIAVISRRTSNVLMTAPFDLPEKLEIVKLSGFGFSVGGALLSAFESDVFEGVVKLLQSGRKHEKQT